MTLEKPPARKLHTNRGAVQSWAAPAGGWSYVQTIGQKCVTVLDTWAGGVPVERVIQPDKILARMTSAEVAAARKAGRLQDTVDGIGFTLPPQDTEQ